MRDTLGPYQMETDVELKTLTAAEVAQVERFTGLRFDELGAQLDALEKSGHFSVLAWSAIAWIAVRRGGNLVHYDVFMETLSAADLLAAVMGTTGAQPAEQPTEQPVPNREERRRAARKRKTPTPVPVPAASRPDVDENPSE